MLLPLLAVLASCDDAGEVVRTRFNATDDVILVDVGVDQELDARAIELHSNTGSALVGEASITPGGGPTGAIHEIVVLVSADYDDLVDAVSVQVDSGARGVEEFDLTADLAVEGLYRTELRSVAPLGESRTDRIEVRLWEESLETDSGAASGG